MTDANKKLIELLISKLNIALLTGKDKEANRIVLKIVKIASKK